MGNVLGKKIFQNLFFLTLFIFFTCYLFHFKQKIVIVHHSSPNSIARPAKLAFKVHYNRPNQIGAQNHIEKHIKPQSNYSHGAEANFKTHASERKVTRLACKCSFIFIFIFFFLRRKSTNPYWKINHYRLKVQNINGKDHPPTTLLNL